MIEKGFDTEAFLFILSTWNFAVFRYAMKNFDLNSFKKTINRLKVLFDKFKGQTLEKINFDKYKNDIIKIFKTLSKIKGVKYTGASKIMHCKIPEVFIMWDRYIRKAYDFKKGKAEDYFKFLKRMQEIFKGLRKKGNRTLAKCIDEYNFAKFAHPVLENNRRERKKK